MNTQKIKSMTEGGKYLAEIREYLRDMVKPGITPLDLENQALIMIRKTGGQPSFKMVPGYHYATCININEGLVHGIPTSIPFSPGDMVSIDLGLYYQGFHTDTATSVVAGTPTSKQKHMIDTGFSALKAGISAALVNNHVSDISKAIQTVIEKAGYTVIRDLTGHGVGKNLHEDPYIPNFYDSRHYDSILTDGQTIALEPMLSTGGYQISVSEEDDWTISTADQSPSILVEHTIAVTSSGPIILTKN